MGKKSLAGVPGTLEWNGTVVGKGGYIDNEARVREVMSLALLKKMRSVGNLSRCELLLEIIS